MSKVIIIGAGPSGLVSAINLAKDNEVIVLEKNSICGKKLLMTGNGRCNYFNDDFTTNHYYSDNKKLISELINDNSKKEVLDFFNSLGIIPRIENGYYYPYSNQASNIKNVLVDKALSLGVKIKNDIEVSNIKKEDDLFILNTNDGEYKCDKLVIATGSCAYPKTGSDGKFYSILEKLGHKIIKPLPALVQLIGKGDYFDLWKGVREDVVIKLYEDNIFVKEEKGQIQLTDYGISGICSMNLSSIISRGLDNKRKEKVIINFYPVEDKENLKEKLINDHKNNPHKDISKLLESILNYKLGNLIIKLLGYKNTDKLDSIDIDKLVNKIINFELEITSTKSFSNSQTCSGGVAISEINLNTMESKIINNLYLVGEIIDINGDCGGYNLALSFITGMRVLI